MNPWPYIAAAYAVTLAGATFVTWQAFISMRRAERSVESLRER